MNNFSKFLTEGYFKVSAIVPTGNGPRRDEGTVNDPKTMNPESVLIKFLSRYGFKTQRQLKQWFLDYKDQSSVKWIDDPRQPKPDAYPKPGDEKQTELFGPQTTFSKQPHFINFPVRENVIPKQDFAIGDTIEVRTVPGSRGIITKIVKNEFGEKEAFIDATNGQTYRIPFSNLLPVLRK